MNEFFHVENSRLLELTELYFGSSRLRTLCEWWRGKATDCSSASSATPSSSPSGPRGKMPVKCQNTVQCHMCPKWIDSKLEMNEPLGSLYRVTIPNGKILPLT